MAEQPYQHVILQSVNILFSGQGNHTPEQLWHMGQLNTPVEEGNIQVTLLTPIAVFLYCVLLSYHEASILLLFMKLLLGV